METNTVDSTKISNHGAPRGHPVWRTKLRPLAFGVTICLVRRDRPPWISLKKLVPSGISHPSRTWLQNRQNKLFRKTYSSPLLRNWMKSCKCSLHLPFQAVYLCVASRQSYPLRLFSHVEQRSSSATEHSAVAMPCGRFNPKPQENGCLTGHPFG